MGKKDKKVVEEDNSEGDEGANSTNKEAEKKEQCFQCRCGKKYGSLAAVHTHINNKHANQKKQYKQTIKNPKKNGQGPSTSIRMKDINYNQQEADLMCLADTTLKNIFDFIKKNDEENKQNTHFLLDENVIDSCDQLDDDDEDIDIIPRRNRTRDIQIKSKLQNMKNLYSIQFLNQKIEGAKQFDVFKLNKFNLTMIRELTKFFSTTFASKIQLELEIIAAQNRELDKTSLEKLNIVERQIWGEKVKICDILNDYYKSWQMLRAKEYKSNH